MLQASLFPSGQCISNSLNIFSKLENLDGSRFQGPECIRSHTAGQQHINGFIGYMLSRLNTSPLYRVYVLAVLEMSTEN